MQQAGQALRSQLPEQSAGQRQATLMLPCQAVYKGNKYSINQSISQSVTRPIHPSSIESLDQSADESKHTWDQLADARREESGERCADGEDGALWSLSPSCTCRGVAGSASVVPERGSGAGIDDVALLNRWGRCNDPASDVPGSAACQDSTLRVLRWPLPAAKQCFRKGW